MHSFLISSKNIEKSAVIWNAFSAIMNSFQTLLLLAVLTRFGTDRDASAFAIGYAVGNLMLQVGKYGIRQYQVTDVNASHSFFSYVRARKITICMMAIFSVLYVSYSMLINGYTTWRASIVLVICMVKLVEAYEDVYHGRLQQIGRLDVAGKILGIRLFLFIIFYAILFVVSKNLVLTTVLSLLITVVLAIILNKIAINEFISTEKKEHSTLIVDSKHILRDCFPLCLSTCLNMYVANSPKYIIDSVVSDEIQTAFNIVFMPVFVLALLGNFIFQPALKKMSLIWNEGKISQFKKIIIKFSFVTIVMTALITLVGYILGIPVLELIYGIDLDNYKSILLIFIIDGGIIALHNLFIMLITIVRNQKYMIYGYIAVAVIEFIFGKTILKNAGIQALCLFFTFMLAGLLVYFILLTMMKFRSNNVNIED